MGWVHDRLQYMARDPIFGKYPHNTLTFRMLYAFHEECVCSSPTMRWWTKGSIAREDAWP